MTGVRAVSVVLAALACGCGEAAPTPEALAPAAPADAAAPEEVVTRRLGGVAIWYGGRWHGRRTASGERFDRHAMTAAHRSLPLGSRVRVTNLMNGHQVVVRINDRGPYGRDRRRVIDLSEAAARELGFLARGSAPVLLELLAGRAAPPAEGRPRRAER